MPVAATIDRMHLRRRHFVTQIARLTLMGLDDTQIGVALGITKQYVSINRRTPLYLSIWTELTTGVVTNLDANIREQQENFTEEIKAMVPTALLAIQDALYDKKNPRIRFEAAKQVLDREGTTAIVSKSQVTQKHEIDFSKHDATADDLLESLKSIAAQADAENPNPIAVKGSDKFKNSSSANSRQQDMMAETINLADFELPKQARVQ